MSCRAVVEQSHTTGAAILVALLVGQAMATMDAAIVNVALPSIQHDLHASGAAIQLVLVGYLLSYGVAIVAGARLGADIGPRRAFLVGLCAFVVTSALGGLAPDPWLLVAARVVQGLAGATMVPQVLAIIQRTFTGAARERAVAFYSLILSAGVFVGQALGGALTSLDIAGLGWRPLFLVNVPIGLVAFVLARRSLPRLEPSGAEGYDVAGMGLLAGAMLCVLVPLVFGRELAWPWWTWLVLAIGLAGLVVFARYERRVQRRGGPMLLDLDVVQNPGVVAAGIAMSVAMGAYAALVFALTLRLQQGLGFSPLRSGATIACYAAGFGASSLLWRRICARTGVGYTVYGYGGFAACSLALAGLLRNGLAWYAIAVLVLAGWCHAATFAPLFNHMLGRVDQRHAAEVSGLLSTLTLLAGAVATAGVGGIYLSAPSSASGITRVTLVIAAAVAVAGFAAAYALNAPAARRVEQLAPG